MSRYIDADKLIRKYIDTDIKKFSNSDVKIVLENLKQNILEAPSIDIVRCKECKHYDKFPTWSACTYWSGDPYEQASVNPNDFCSYGEREGE